MYADAGPGASSMLCLFDPKVEGGRHSDCWPGIGDLQQHYAPDLIESEIAFNKIHEILGVTCNSVSISGPKAGEKDPKSAHQVHRRKPYISSG
jgi:hypothetical protein